MTTFVKYLDQVEIPSLGTINVFNTIDLTGLYDSDATGVIVQAWNSNVGPGADFMTTVEVGTPSTHSTRQRFLPYHWMQTAISLVGGTSISVKPASANQKLYIAGEIFDDNAVVHAAPIYHNLGSPFDVWQNVTATPDGTDVLGDISAVIVRSVSGGAGKIGVRQGGTTSPHDTMEWEQGMTWWVVGVNTSGIYEVWTGGKDEDENYYFAEIGYIKKTSRVTTVAEYYSAGDIAPGTQGSFGALDLTGVVPANTVTAGFWWYAQSMPSALEAAYLRNTGSSEDDNSLTGLFNDGPHHQTQFVGVDANLACEYRLSDALIELYLMWYETTVGTDFAEVETNAHMGHGVGAHATTVHGAEAKPVISGAGGAVAYMGVS